MEEGLVLAGGEHSVVGVVGVDECDEETIGEELCGEVHHGVDVALCGVGEEHSMGLRNGSRSRVMGMDITGGSFLAAHLFYLRNPLWMMDGRALQRLFLSFTWKS